MMRISTKEAERLQKEWGDKECNHPSWGKEDFFKDYVCLQCGLTIAPCCYEALFKNAKKQKS